MKYFFKKNALSIVVAISIYVVIVIVSLLRTFMYDEDIFVFDSFKIEASVNEDGSMRIKERIEVTFDEDSNGEFWRDIVTSKNNNGVATNTSSFDPNNFTMKVYDQTGNELLFDSTNPSTSKIYMYGYSWENDVDAYYDRIRCEGYGSDCECAYSYVQTYLYPTRIYEFEYVLDGFVTCYDDVAEINNAFFDPIESIEISNVEVKINFPSSTSDVNNIELFTHGAVVSEKNVTVNSVSYKIPRIYPGDAIESRVIFPRSMITSPAVKNVIPGNGYDKLIALEDEISSMDYLFMVVGNYATYILGALFLVILVIVIKKSYDKFDKELVSDFYGDYYRELPATYPPAEMGYLVNFKESNKEDLTATIMDLIRRGYIEVDYTNQSLTDENADYTLIRKYDKDINELEEYEKYTLEWFFDIIGNKSSEIKLSTIDNYTKKDSCAQKYHNCNEKWNRLVKKSSDKQDFFDKKAEGALSSKYGSTVIAILMISIIAVLLNFVFDGLIIPLPYVIGLIISICIVTISYLKNIKRRSKQGNEDYVRWMAFKKFLMEFGNMDDYPIPALTIWEHYLVYASAFGIADLVNKQLKMKYSSSLGEIESSEYYRPTVVYVRLNRRFARSYMYHQQSYARYQAAQAKSSGGRSGFGGGRSFGGGGGGARGR